MILFILSQNNNINITSNKKLGTYYCSFKANGNTTWYITFDKEEERYIVQDIANNHSADYAYFIANIKKRSLQLE